MRLGLVVLFVFWISSLVMAGDIAQQVVTYRIDPINEISINGGTNSLVMRDLAKSGGSARWAITTNETSKRVVGILDADLPPGVELYVELEGPQGSQNRGAVSLSTDPQDLVTQISRVADDNLKLSYRLAAERDTSGMKLQRVLTLILTDGH